MSQIFSISRSGALTEYDTVNYALDANGFAIVKYTDYKGIEKYQFYSGETFEGELGYKNWKLRPVSFDINGRMNFKIIDQKGMVRNYRTNSNHFSGLSEMIKRFASVTEFIDHLDEEAHRREEEQAKQQASLQKQIDELKVEIEMIKQKIEPNPMNVN